MNLPSCSLTAFVAPEETLKRRRSMAGSLSTGGPGGAMAAAAAAAAMAAMAD